MGKVVTVRVEDETWVRLNERAVAEDRSVSWLVRQAIVEFLGDAQVPDLGVRPVVVGGERHDVEGRRVGVVVPVGVPPLQVDDVGRDGVEGGERGTGVGRDGQRTSGGLGRRSVPDVPGVTKGLRAACEVHPPDRLTKHTWGTTCGECGHKVR